MGAISGSGSGFVLAASNSCSRFSVRTCLRCFFCILLVLTLTGAEPTFDGGGEFALDIDAEVMEALSDMISLVGVPDRSIFEAEAKLA